MKTSVLVAAALLLASALQAQVCVKDGETIAFMGDSITAGGAGPAGYCSMVMRGLELVGVKNAKSIMSGVGGNKSVQMHERLDSHILARKDGEKADWMTFSCGLCLRCGGRRGNGNGGGELRRADIRRIAIVGHQVLPHEGADSGKVSGAWRVNVS